MHNLYRNNWKQITIFRDNFAQPLPPAKWALDFRTRWKMRLSTISGPALVKAVLRLMRHPLYREAHATDDHYAPLLFVAGAAGSLQDVNKKNKINGGMLELQNMCNSRKFLVFYMDLLGIASTKADKQSSIGWFDRVPIRQLVARSFLSFLYIHLCSCLSRTESIQTLYPAFGRTACVRLYI